jgi:hypothetical protein
VAPNSPSARPQASAAPAASAGDWDRDAHERPALAGPQRARRLQQPRVDALERGDRLAHVERAGDERERDHDAGGLQHERDPGGVQRPARESVRPQRGQQPDPRHGGRDDQRQLDERDRQRPAGEVPRGEHP